MNPLNKEILIGALDKNICKEWAAMLPNADINQLLKMYIDGIDFCLSNDFPSKEFLKDKAGDLLPDYGIFVDENVSLRNPEKTVLLGSCGAVVLFCDYVVSQVFIKHASTASIDVTDNAFVVIDLFDDSILNIQAWGNSKVLVNVYGNAKVEHEVSGKAYVKVVNKLKKTY